MTARHEQARSPSAACGPDSRPVAPTDLWGDYWAGAGLHGCTDQFPPDVSRQLAAAWGERFGRLAPGASVLDVACGRGAVLAAAREAGAMARGATATGVDLAPATTLAGAGFAIRGGVDATALPFADRSFTWVTSQFGMEYAGLPAALDEAARVADSRIAILTHAAEGVVAQHAGEQAGQAEALLAAGQLSTRLRSAIDHVATFDAVLAGIAALVASATNRGLLEQLYGSIAELRRRAPVMPAADATAAVDFMVGQLERHTARMRALARAAPGRAQIMDAAAQLRAGGFETALSEQRSPRGDLVGYWLDASRRGQP